ncbi:MAG: glycosyltransferase, partial [Bacteroidota bacterium]
SIKEAIYAEVPMLVYPVDFNTDQPGNAARVTYHKLGLHGDLARDSQYAIEEKLTALITEPEFVNNVRAMKTVDRDYSPDRFVEALKEIRSLE